MTKVYINLPVQNLEHATAFYEALGFIKNPSFSNEQASGMCYDESVHVIDSRIYQKFSTSS